MLVNTKFWRADPFGLPYLIKFPVSKTKTLTMRLTSWKVSIDKILLNNMIYLIFTLILVFSRMGKASSVFFSNHKKGFSWIAFLHFCISIFRKTLLLHTLSKTVCWLLVNTKFWRVNPFGLSYLMDFPLAKFLVNNVLTHFHADVWTSIGII